MEKRPSLLNSYRAFYTSEFAAGLFFGLGTGCMVGHFLLDGQSSTVVVIVGIALEVIGSLIVKKRSPPRTHNQ